jgi:hypothetical protein
LCVEATGGLVTERRTRSATTAATTRAAWDDDVERLYESWHRRSAAAETGHRRMSERMRRRYVLLGIPIVILTTVVGTSVFASLQHDTVSTPLRILVGSLSILAAVMSSLQAFLRYGTRAEGHRIATIRYETLRRDMSETLAIPRASRPDTVRELDSVRQRLDRYAKESPIVDERLWAKLERQFHLSQVPPDPRWDRTVRIPETAPASASPIEDPARKGAHGGR